jgi:hypothetical protein
LLFLIETAFSIAITGIAAEIPLDSKVLHRPTGNVLPNRINNKWQINGINGKINNGI